MPGDPPALLEAPLGVYFTVRCRREACSWATSHSLGPAGYNLAVGNYVAHIEEAHPRAWVHHLKHTTTPVAP